MARIRSTHADQWTDDDFVELTPLARLLSLGIRNFADDNGILPVKLKRWKMQVLPADNCDIKALGKELIEHRQIRVFEVDGTQYAEIRNFKRFQRPKSPSYLYPTPPNSEWGEDERGEFPKSDDLSVDHSGNSSAEVEKGSRRVVVEKGSTPSTGGRDATRPTNGTLDFDAFKAVYPKRAGNQPWRRAMQAATKRITEGYTFDDIFAGAMRYAAFCEATDKTNTEFVMQAATFLGPERNFLKDWDPPRPRPGKENPIDQMRRLREEGKI